MQPSLTTAPDAVLEALFSACDYAELFACSHVCTSWRRHAARSSLWRRVAQEDFTRAHNTEYQVVATPVHKYAAVSSSLNTADLFAVEVRMRQHSRGEDDYYIAAQAVAREGHAERYGGVPSHAQGLHVYSFGGAFGASTTSSPYYSRSSRSGGGGGPGDVQRRSSSTCFSGLGSSTEVREVCMRYIEPLGFTAGHGVISAMRREKARLARALVPTTDSADTEADQPLPLWEDGSILRNGVLLCDPHDPGTFCFYAATLQRPWCTVMIDRFFVDDTVLHRLGRYRADGSEKDAAASCCLDLAFRIEELSVVRNDPRHPLRTVTPAQPVAIRIGVLEQGQLAAYQRGLRHILTDIVFHSATQPAADEEDEDDDHEKSDGDERSAAAAAAADPSRYAWGALDSPSTAWGGAARTNGGRHPSPPPDDEIDAEAEVAAWFEASLQAALQAEGASPTQAPRRSAEGAAAPAWSNAREFADTHRATTRSASYTQAGAARDGAEGAAFALGDTAASYGYDAEGNYVSDGVAYPLGPPLAKEDVVHLQFWGDEDVIAVARNGERLGTLVADAFSEKQRWCVAVSLQNCGVRFIPPRLS